MKMYSKCLQTTTALHNIHKSAQILLTYLLVFFCYHEKVLLLGYLIVKKEKNTEEMESEI